MGVLTRASAATTWRGLIVSALWLGAGACASAPVVTRPEAPAAIVPLDRRIAWVLRLEAQRVLRDPDVTPVEFTTPVTPSPARSADLQALVADLDPAVRRRAALAIGRVGLREGTPLLEAALSDPDADVRASAAFALGLLGDVEAEMALRAALDDPEPLVRGRAAEGLGLIAAQVATPDAPRDRWLGAATEVADASTGCPALIAPLAPDDETTQVVEVEACRLALFALVRLRHYDSLARVALTPDGQPASAWWPVAYALQRIGDPRAVPALVSLARSAGVYAVAFALRGLAGRPEALPIAQRFAIDDTADPRLRATAIQALGRAGAPAADTLIALLGVRGLPTTLAVETLNALAATRDRRAFELMIDRVTDPRPPIRAAALAGAARVDPEAFLFVVSSLGADREWSVRAALARTLGTLEPDRVRAGLLDFMDDQDQRVRSPALEALVRVGAPDLAARLLEALEVPDFGIRATAARLVGEVRPDGSVAALTAAYERGLSDAAFEARASAVAALAAIGTPDALAVVARARADRDWAVRVRAVDLLRRAGDTAADADRPAPLRQAPEFFESAALLHPPFSPVALIETRHGVIEVELNVVEAPLTTLSFVDLARAGFFNGLTIHRLVPNFVAQTGDPRGDGIGGPGYAIVDELSPLPFVRGTVGMALSWRDTGGSQFFITHSPQPHLDGRYAVFGRVVKGMDVVDRLAMGDRIDRIRIWDGVVLK